MTNNTSGIDNSNLAWDIEQNCMFITVMLDGEEYHIAGDFSAVQGSTSVYSYAAQQISLAKSGQPYMTWKKINGRYAMLNSRDLVT